MLSSACLKPEIVSFVRFRTFLLASFIICISIAGHESAFAKENRATSKPSNSSQGQSKRVKYKKDTKVNFDDELIEGGVKNPFSSMIGGRDGDNKSGFIKIRKEWHDQMIMSVNGLSQ